MLCLPVVCIREGLSYHHIPLDSNPQNSRIFQLSTFITEITNTPHETISCPPGRATVDRLRDIPWKSKFKIINMFLSAHLIRLWSIMGEMYYFDFFFFFFDNYCQRCSSFSINTPSNNSLNSLFLQGLCASSGFPQLSLGDSTPWNECQPIAGHKWSINKLRQHVRQWKGELRGDTWHCLCYGVIFCLYLHIYIGCALQQLKENEVFVFH